MDTKTFTCSSSQELKHRLVIVFSSLFHFFKVLCLIVVLSCVYPELGHRAPAGPGEHWSVCSSAAGGGGEEWSRTICHQLHGSSTHSSECRQANSVATFTLLFILFILLNHSIPCQSGPVSMDTVKNFHSGAIVELFGFIISIDELINWLSSGWFDENNVIGVMCNDMQMTQDVRSTSQEYRNIFFLVIFKTFAAWVNKAARLLSQNCFQGKRKTSVNKCFIRTNEKYLKITIVNISAKIHIHT